MVTDNWEVAIFTRLNELAERHGLSPFDFSASLSRDGKGHSMLIFHVVPDEEIPTERFTRLLAGLGITDDDTLHIEGTDEQIYDTLTWAIQNAPRPPQRGR